MQGTIQKAIAGFYDVKVDGQSYQCKARGIFKKTGIKPAVGDKVKIALLEEGEGIINEILPRKNWFIRPFVANVDLFAVVLAVKNPEPNPAVIDRFLVMAEKHNTDIILCVNKMDLEGQWAQMEAIYQNLYPMVKVSTKTGQGIPELQEALVGKQAALAGPSGVGKSAILNRLLPSASAETGHISQKTKRGKHTTRHIQLFHLDEKTAVFDTPGFTAFDLPDTTEAELHHLFPELRPLIGHCKYDDCKHTEEPDCAVRTALDKGRIHPSRYASYLSLLKEVRQSKQY